MTTKKVYNTVEEMKADAETLRQEEFIYDPKFVEKNPPKDQSYTSVLMSVISQLKPGVDVTKFQAPIFIVKPKSYLEMTSEYVQPNSFMVKVSTLPTPELRMFTICKWILFNMSLTPQKGFSRMKPYNPILGEQFYCKWEHEDSTTNFYAEQVSHHPPVSALYMENRKYNWVYTSTTAPKSTFWGNKVDMTIEGEHVMHLLALGEKYVVEWPIIIGRGIILGTSMVEHNEYLRISCEKTGLEAKIDLKKKNNEVEGYIAKGKENFYKITGYLDKQVKVQDLKTKATEIYYDTKTTPRPNKIVKPVAEQKINESRRVWHHVTNFLLTNDFDTAGKYKNFVEEEQRKISKQRKEKNEQWTPQEFKPTSRQTKLGTVVYEYIHQNLNPTSTPAKEEAVLDLD